MASYMIKRIISQTANALHHLHAQGNIFFVFNFRNYA